MTLLQRNLKLAEVLNILTFDVEGPLLDERRNMNNMDKVENNPAQNQQLAAALAQLSDAEVAQLLDTVKSLQVDLLRLIPLFKGKEPTETVTNTQEVLAILISQIDQSIAGKWTKDIPDHLPNLGTERIRVDYAPMNRLLRQLYDGKPYLIWADI